MPDVFPDYKAPIVRNGADGRELATARWGMPSSSKALMDATKKRAEKLLGLFERTTWPVVPAGTAARPTSQGPKVDIGARMRGMWR